jgi:DNA replication protein DnaC
MHTALVMAGYESSGIANLLATQTFETFSLQYCQSSPDVLSKMRQNKEILEQFACNFRQDTYVNFALFGGTGLGKTHLSSAVAKCVIERGFDVRYAGAMKLFGDFEAARFGGGNRAADTEIYYEADLLIVDDLGTELTNQFTVSCLYDLINSRILRRKPTILSTNLTPKDLAQRYTDRVCSRILGEYQPLIFVGSDVRMQKLRKEH